MTSIETMVRFNSQIEVHFWNSGVKKLMFDLQVNYLGHFLLIGQLLQVMKKSDSDDKRIVLVSSDMHRWAKYDGSDINSSEDPRKYSMYNCYGRSKLYQVEFHFTVMLH